ncbi:cell division protein ZapE [Sphingobium nicotianae]|uniref:AFG1 family ATPase n=1 Tax=Sphingobium nicotianae TaxID=2782607 RepID=A0A9X1ISW3_9SPHN|nr:AFG1 family ATPase [Sphingobium nicotianae]
MITLLNRYDELIADGELQPDPAQRKAAVRLTQLQQELEATPRRGSVLWRMLRKAPEPIRGVYLWGGVGRGKSMLMDLLRDCLEGPAKRRTHFHEFMLDVHARLRAARESESGDPIPPVVAAIAEEAKVLLFDEMVVNNPVDAAIMSRLFTGLFDAGVTLVATSNRAPDDLYKDGINRDLFLPFIALLKERLDVLPLNGPIDYRLDRLGGMDTWHVPNGDETTAKLREIFFRLTDYPPEDSANVPSEELAVGGGRTMYVPKSLKGVAVFSFKRLCGEPRGASDYLAIARRFHTVIIVGIPVMGPENRNEAARFVTLIDALYEKKVKLIAGADAQPADLYPAGDGSFEFERTVSRLMEMQSLDYLALGHGASG